MSGSEFISVQRFISTVTMIASIELFIAGVNSKSISSMDFIHNIIYIRSLTYSNSHTHTKH